MIYVALICDCGSFAWFVLVFWRVDWLGLVVGWLRQVAADLDG